MECPVCKKFIYQSESLDEEAENILEHTKEHGIESLFSIEKLKTLEFVYDKLVSVEKVHTLWNIPIKNRNKIEGIKDSIRKEGRVIPLLVIKRGEEYYILNGETRFLAIKELNFKEIPVVFK